MNRQLSEEVKALGLVKRYGGKLFDKLRLHESACQHRRVLAVLKYLHA